MQDKKLETQLVHAGNHPDQNQGIINPPVYHASTVLFPTVQELKAGKQKVRYGRRGTPTSFALEEAVARLEGGYACHATPSGLSAITIALLSYLSNGDHLLVTDSVYEPSRTFIDQTLSRYGISATYYDPLIGAGIADLIRPNTRVVFTESPGSQTFEVQDLPAIVEAAHKAGALVLLDNTWATPLYLRAFDLGVDVVIEAATKYLSGHSDTMMGTITTTEAAWRDLHRTYGNLGMCIAPDDAYLVMRGMRTMHVRLRHHMAAALDMAEWLEGRPEVAKVLHPALPSHPGHQIWKRDFKGASGLFGMVLKPCSDKQLAAMLDGLDLFGMGYSWGGYESLIIPATPHRTATKWAGDGPLLRLHIGLEAVDDLKADLEAGFERLNRA